MFYETAVSSTMMYESRRLEINKKEALTINDVEMRMLKWTCRFTNEYIRENLGVTNTVGNIKENTLR